MEFSKFYKNCFDIESVGPQALTRGVSARNRVSVLRTPWHQRSVGTNMLIVPPSEWYYKDFSTNKGLVLSLE